MDGRSRRERRKLEGRAASPAPTQKLMRPLGEWLVCGPIKDQLGLTRMRNAFTGGEALGEDTFVFYRALGVQAAPALRPDREQRLQRHAGTGRGAAAHRRPAAARRRGCRSARTARSWCARASVFGGYYRNDEATQRGARRTAGCTPATPATSKPDGHLVVLGRLSEVVHTAQGERYIPNYIENRLKFSP